MKFDEFKADIQYEADLLCAEVKRSAALEELPKKQFDEEALRKWQKHQDNIDKIIYSIRDLVREYSNGIKRKEE